MAGPEEGVPRPRDAPLSSLQPPDAAEVLKHIEAYTDGGLTEIPLFRGEQ